MACTTVAKQTYALPARPDLNTGMGSASSLPQAEPAGDVRPISNDTLQSEDTTGAPVRSGGFLGAPTPLHSGVIERDQPEPVAAPVSAPATEPVMAPAQPASAAPAPVNAPVTAPGSVQGSVSAPAGAAATGSYVVQVGAVSDSARASQWQQKLSQQFSVPGRVTPNGAVYRVQLGPFNSKSEAAALQQRLSSEAQLQSFITNGGAQ